MAARLEGKVAIVTGAAHGLGAVVALALAREGASVAAVDVCHDLPPVSCPMGTEDELNKVVEDIKTLGRKAIAVKCDVSKASEVERMIKRVLDEFGRVDILVNNAGVVTFAPFVELTEEEWNLIMDVNLKGPFHCCKHVIPHMIAQKAGKIVNIGSVDGRQAMPSRLAHYCSSKAGLHMFTEALSKEMAEHNINVNCVAPGPIWTPMIEYALGGAAQYSELELKEAFKGAVRGMQDFAREVTLEDVANAVLFLVSEESRNITGFTIYVDGGNKRAM
jgi:NAD(P)-dependent dehydrogenase (short-subunit alcohol dehydrogenase family)